MEILLLKALHEEDFGHELYQYLRFLTKEAIKIISLLKASRKLLVSEVLKLVKLIILAPTTNVASERSRSALCRVKTYL